jgi:hypothetical protein
LAYSIPAYEKPRDLQVEIQDSTVREALVNE